MKSLFLILLLFIGTFLSAQTTVVDYLDCLKQHNKSPKEYIMRLFENNDIVILGERDHKDTTQYDLILDIIGDKRFIEKVGYVYTEAGVVNRTDWANKLIKSNYNCSAEFEKELLKLYRELDFNPLWEKYNMYKYLKGLYNINMTLDDSDKITIGLTDCEFVWDGMTSIKYKEFNDRINKNPFTRDSIMANNFIKLYEKQKIINGNLKALLIQSLPHAINIDIAYNKYRAKTVGSYIFDKYGEKIKIVALNYYLYAQDKLLDDGKCDAAFEMTQCNCVGFNLKDTPFGKVPYYYEGGQYGEFCFGKEMKYEELLDGMIYYLPFYENVPTIGIPNVIDDDFAKEMVCREIISGDYNWIQSLGIRIASYYYKMRFKKYYNNVRVLKCPHYDVMKSTMNKWLNRDVQSH